MKQRKKKMILAGLILVLSGIRAQAEPANSQTALQMESVVVTAQKKEENVQQIPISIDAFTEIDLQDAGIDSTRDLIQFSPNVHMKESHVEHAIMIRGVSTFHSSVYSPAGYYVDGISYPLHYMQNTGLLDVERAEILKGPQGTLYGRNSESGLINIITRQPGNEFEGRIFTEIAEFNSIKAGARFSGPAITDKLFFGGAFQYDTSDGYFENETTGDDTIQDREHSNGRLTLRWVPGDRWDISFIADAMDVSDHGGGFRFITGPNKTDRYKTRKSDPVDEYVNQDENSQALRITYKGDWFEVISASSLLHQTIDKQNEMNFWVAPAYQKVNVMGITEEMVSQEFRITSKTDGPFEWITGLYGFIEETDFDFRVYAKSSGTDIQYPETDIDTSGYAIFGQGTYTIGDKLHLTAGARLDHQDLDGEFIDTINALNLDKELTYDEFLPKFSAAYDIAPDAMVYGSISKGYLVGGYNFLNQSDSEFHYDPEYTWNYETGIKSAWLGNRFMANLSLFHITIEDKQVADMDVLTHVSIISNAAKAHASGMELQIKARPVIGLDVFAGFGFTESKFDKFRDADGVDYEDNYLPYAPKYTYNAGIQYRSSYSVFYRADLFGTDRFYASPSNISKQNAYQTVNLTIGYEGASFDVYLWAKNLFDEEYCTWIKAVSTETIGMDGEPQIFGVTLAYRF